jgi:hypothetical protein
MKMIICCVVETLSNSDIDRVNRMVCMAEGRTVSRSSPFINVQADFYIILFGYGYIAFG